MFLIISLSEARSETFFKTLPKFSTIVRMAFSSFAAQLALSDMEVDVGADEDGDTVVCV